MGDPLTIEVCHEQDYAILTAAGEMTFPQCPRSASAFSTWQPVAARW